MDNPILDNFGQPLRQSLFGSNGINESVKRRHSTQVIKDQEKDWGELFPSHDVKRMRSACRTLYENNGVVKAAINIVADYSVGDAFDPIYKGGDTAWGEQATDWLHSWFSRCDVRGDSFDFKSTLSIDSVSLDRDGGGYCALIKSRTGYPLLQHISAHRVGSRLGTDDEVKEGRYKGLRIVNGSILNKYGRVVAYRVLGSEESKDRDVSARSFMPLFDPRYYDQSSGIPSLSHAIEAFRKMAKSTEYELMRQVIESQISLIEYNEGGEFNADTGLGVTANGIRVEEIDGGQIRYMSAGSAERIETLSPSGNPSDQFMNLQARMTRESLAGLGLSSGIVIKPEGQGTADRADLAKADKAIAKRQCILKKHAKKKILFALACAIERGDLPASNDWMSWSFTLPKKISIDLGRDSKTQSNEYDKGILNLTDIVGDGRVKAHLRTRANEEAQAIKITKQVEQEQGVDIDPRRMRLLTPNEQPESNDE